MASHATQYRRVEPARVEQREAPRHRLTISSATVRPHGGAPCEATLHDLSSYGCRVSGDVRFAAGDRLWLRLAGGMPVAATVAWDEAPFTGCRFDLPITRELVRRLTLVIV